MNQVVAKTAQDYMPPMPKGLQAQIDEVNKMISGEAPLPAQTEEPELPLGIETRPQPTNPTPVTPDTTATTTPAPANSNGDDQTWEQRYRSLEGRNQALQRNYNAMTERFNQLEETIARLQATAEPATPAEPAQPTKLLTPQEEDEYGTEMLQVVGKRAREEISPELKALADRLARVEGRVDGVAKVTAKSSEQKMFDVLNSETPGWQQVNVDEDFKSWLQQPDPYSGRKRHDMLLEAYSRHEGARVVQFFKGFAEATGNPTTTQAKTDATAPLNNGTGQKPSLAEFAAPGRARSAPQELTPEKPIYNSAFIVKFTADKIAGKWRGREAEADAIERDIFLAQREGRIVP